MPYSDRIRDTVGLTPGATQTSSFNAAVGFIYRINVSTAQIIVTPPSSPVADDRFGYFIGTQSTSTSATYVLAPAFCAELATGTYHSASYTQKAAPGGNKWSIWLSGELMVWRYVDGTVGWILEIDGRIPHQTFMRRTTQWTGTPLTNATFTKVNMESTEFDIGGLADVTTNETLAIKRAGNYRMSGLCSADGQGDQHRTIVSIYKGGTEFQRGPTTYVSTAGSNHTTIAFASAIRNLAAADTLDVRCYQDSGAAVNTGTTAALMPYLSAAEQL